MEFQDEQETRRASRRRLLARLAGSAFLVLNACLWGGSMFLASLGRGLRGAGPLTSDESTFYGAGFLLLGIGLTGVWAVRRSWMVAACAVLASLALPALWEARAWDEARIAKHNEERRQQVRERVTAAVEEDCLFHHGGRHYVFLDDLVVELRPSEVGVFVEPVGRVAGDHLQIWIESDNDHLRRLALGRFQGAVDGEGRPVEERFHLEVVPISRDVERAARARVRPLKELYRP